jgi:hypothetical protein
VRLVLDTNVVISALRWRGTPYRLLEAIRRQDGLQLYSSSALLENMSREEFLRCSHAAGCHSQSFRHRRSCHEKEYYNRERTHTSLGGVTPTARAENSARRPLDLAEYRWRPHCRGLYQLPVGA